MAGVALAAAIAVAARHARALSPSGAAAATLVGAAAVAAGWAWGALLIAFFVASTTLSRWGAARKEALTRAVVDKGAERDALQVFANGGLFAGAALLYLTAPDPRLMAAGAGALAAATADTWATEVGTLLGGAPRSALTLQPLAPGMSGGVTPVGTLAAVAGAAFIAAVAWALGWPGAAGAALLGGVVGCAADSVIGATIQARRRCPRCQTLTERTTHVCGEVTQPAGGLAWLDNDGVNLASGAVGAVVAWLCAQ